MHHASKIALGFHYDTYVRWFFFYRTSMGGCTQNQRKRERVRIVSITTPTSPGWAICSFPSPVPLRAFFPAFFPECSSKLRAACTKVTKCTECQQAPSFVESDDFTLRCVLSTVHALIARCPLPLGLSRPPFCVFLCVRVCALYFRAWAPHLLLCPSIPRAVMTPLHSPLLFFLFLFVCLLSGSLLSFALSFLLMMRFCCLCARAGTHTHASSAAADPAKKKIANAFAAGLSFFLSRSLNVEESASKLNCNCWIFFFFWVMPVLGFKSL